MDELVNFFIKLVALVFNILVKNSDTNITRYVCKGNKSDYQMNFCIEF